MKKFAILSILILTFCLAPLSKPTFADGNGARTSEIVMEINSKRVLYEKSARQKMYMASTTKILTAITIIENCDLSAKVKIKKEWCGIEGSSVYLEPNETLTVKELLYGLMLRSGNDTAVSLASYCSENIKNFANLMNETAKKIGANNSNFVNPHGLHDDEHYTTAYDLGLISCYAMKNQAFKEIVGTKRIEISNGSKNYKRILVNKNKMLNEFSGATGIKTGYTKKAGRCLVSSANLNGIELVVVVLNCAPMFEVSKELLKKYSDIYKNVKIVESDNVVDFIEVDNRKSLQNSDKNKVCGVYIKRDIIIPIRESELNKVEIKRNYIKKLSAPFSNDTEIGNIQIYISNSLIFSEKVYTINNIK